MYIYKIVNKLNGMTYVGQTTKTPEERFNDHFKRKDTNQMFALDMKKYGKSAFYVEGLKKCSTRKQLDRWEQKYIEELNTIYPNGYNMTGGGRDHGGKISPVLREALKEWQKVSKIEIKKRNERQRKERLKSIPKNYNDGYADDFFSNLAAIDLDND